MILKQLFGAVPVVLLVLGNGATKAGQIINEAGDLSGLMARKRDFRGAAHGREKMDTKPKTINLPTST